MSRSARPNRARCVQTILSAAAITLAGKAMATWSIVICDTRTGEVAVASATCLTNFDLQANTPVLIVGVGGATAQSSVDQNALNRTFIRDRLYAGMAPADILTGLAAFDGSHQTRQYGMGDTLGRPLTFSGSGAGMWKGGTTGQIGDLVYAVQGNVLWGPLVVDKAVEAIINTPGDMPAKLMASMEAARAWGGDGRCSCSQADPDGCTTIPPTFKSAHIAYMIIGRAGDRDGSNGNYRLGTFATSITTGEFTSDGRNDVAAVGSGGVAVFPGAAAPGQPPMLGGSIPMPVGFSPRDLAAADFNGDNKTDLVITDNAGDAINVLMGNGNGTFAAPVVYAAGDGAQSVVTGHFNADSSPDIACSNVNSTSITIFLNSGNGTFGAPSSVTPGAGTQLFAPGDADGDGDIDLMAGSSSAKTLIVYKNNGSGSFTQGTTTLLAASVNSVDTADLNADGRPDLLVTLTSGSSVNILMQQPDTTYQIGTVLIGGTATQGYLYEITGDGVRDIVVGQKGQSRMYVIPGLGGGLFGTPAWYPIGFSPQSMRLEDMDGDGDVDPVMRMSGGVMCLQQHAGGGVFNSYSGLAGGDYFMDFNIANQNNQAVDPVFQCQALFDAWRTDLIGKPDAVQSLASFTPSVIHADGQSSTMLHIQARDWQLSEVSLDAADISVSVFGDNVVNTGAPIHNRDGTVSVPVTAQNTCGTAVFEVTINGLGRKVVLMPRIALTISDPSDFDNSGFVDLDDFTTFVAAFEVGEDNADFDRSGFVDLDDFISFVNQFENPC
ncbi:MAG: VCBS repeat-containing protein [Phycisphaerales bacterium]|nr:VCBS repeat-containing protein [Phycisphaerales bacterium]